MTAPRRKLCPVCWQYVPRTKGDCIAGHWDTALNPCLASGEPYRITMSRKPIRRAEAA